MKTRNIILMILLGLITFLVGCMEITDEDAEDTITIIANSGWPEASLHSQGIKEFSEKVNSLTDGKVEIDVRTDEQLGFKSGNLLKAVSDNNVTISDMLMSGEEGDEPLFGVTVLPFLTSDYEEARLFMEVATPYFKEITEEKWNQKILYTASWPFGNFWTKNEIKTIEDLNGLKMRSTDQININLIQEFGGVPSSMPFSEVYSSLSTGVIDSVETSSVTAVDGKFWEVLNYNLPVRIATAQNMVTINLDEFNKLDKDIQDAIVQAGEEMQEVMWEKVEALDQEMLDTVQENGIIETEISNELMDDLREIANELIDKYLDSAPFEAQEIVDEFREKVN